MSKQSTNKQKPQVIAKTLYLYSIGLPAITFIMTVAAAVLGFYQYAPINYILFTVAGVMLVLFLLCMFIHPYAITYDTDKKILTIRGDKGLFGIFKKRELSLEDVLSVTAVPLKHKANSFFNFIAVYLPNRNAGLYIWTKDKKIAIKTLRKPEEAGEIINKLLESVKKNSEN